MTKYKKIEETIIMQQLPQIHDSLTVIIGNLQLLAEGKDNEEGRLYRELIKEGYKINQAIAVLFPPGVISKR
ncbi:hypothetical protein [Desulfotomaculum sp. 1211_IL3151]|uniref:hypothetical protein n=1 Tax=Desulfotomaculum sp. 1211_IL3151 TaxID=3084055 RepID=UPI002FDA4281